MTVKESPKTWVDDLLKNGHSNWIPPVKRYSGLDDGEMPLDWEDEYRRLEKHHDQETTVLNAVIRELVRRVNER